jgi:hypothetical protein
VIRYRYNQQYSPPAPFIHVSVRCAETGLMVEQLPAQIDTAADKTVVPLEVIHRLSALPLRQIPVGGLGGHILLLQTFLLQLAVRDMPFVMIEVLGSPDEGHILLGRDLVNGHRVLLDGPGLMLEIS